MKKKKEIDLAFPLPVRIYQKHQKMIRIIKKKSGMKNAEIVRASIELYYATYER